MDSRQLWAQHLQLTQEHRQPSPPGVLSVARGQPGSQSSDQQGLQTQDWVSRGTPLLETQVLGGLAGEGTRQGMHRRGLNGDRGDICCVPTTLYPFHSLMLGRVEGQPSSGRCLVPLTPGQESLDLEGEQGPRAGMCLVHTVVRTDTAVQTRERSPSRGIQSACVVLLRGGSRPGQTGSCFCKIGTQRSPRLPRAGPAVKQCREPFESCIWVCV